MDKKIENMDAVDWNIIDAIKTIRFCIKKRPDENTIVDYLCKFCLDFNATTIRQRTTFLKNKNKILSKPHNGENSYYLIDDSVIISDELASPNEPPIVDTIIWPGIS